MTSHRGRAFGEIRHDWMIRVASLAQVEVLRNHRPADQICAAFWNGASEPATRLEELVLQGLAVEVALGELGQTHQERGERLSAAFRIPGQSATPARRRPKRSGVGPCTRATVVAATKRIAETSCSPLDIKKLATELNCRERALREHFRQVVGVSIRAYHVRARVAKAVAEYLDGTTDVLALERLCGYKASKNFYRAFATVLGIRPSQLRQVPVGELRAWLDAQSAIPVNPHVRFDSGQR